MNNKNKKKCLPTISDRCPSPTMNAKCVDYEGILLEKTTLDPDDCNTVEDVIEDIIVAVDQNTDDLDMTSMGCCMEYEPSDTDRGLTLKDILNTHESFLCEHEKRITQLEKGEEPEKCSDCDSGCEDEKSNCCNILVHSSYGSGEIFINNSYLNFKALPNNAYPNMEYRALKKGTYKITLDLGCENGAIGHGFFVGVSINNFDPLQNPFYQQSFSPLHNSKTIHFLVDLLKNDNIQIKYKHLAGNIAIDGVKLIIEKVK